MATYELLYETAGNRDIVHIDGYDVTDDGRLSYHYEGGEDYLSKNTEWVITALPTESSFCGISHEEAWYHLNFETASRRETFGIDYHAEEDDGTLSFRRMDGRYGRLDPSAEWQVTNNSSTRGEYEKHRPEKIHTPTTKPNTLPSDWDEIRKQAYASDAYTCRYCGSKGGNRGDAELHAHHLIPKENGGVHSLHNLITLCRDCHHAAHGRRVAPDVE